LFAIFDLTFYASSFLLRLRTGNLQYWQAWKPPVAAPGPVSTDLGDRLTLGGYHLAGGYAGLEPQTVLPLNDPRYLQLMGVTAIQDGQGEWHLSPEPPLAPIRLAVPVYSAHPLDALARVDLIRDAVVTQKLSVDTSATSPGNGTVRIIRQYPGLVQIAAETSGRALCVVAQRFHPGWTARIGDLKLPVMAVDGDLTGFIAPGGRQDVILEFRPADFFLGRNVSLISLLVVIGALGTNLILNRRRTA
jgi:hypothetical protein